MRINFSWPSFRRRAIRKGSYDEIIASVTNLLQQLQLEPLKDVATWGKAKELIGGYLNTLWRNGTLQGNTSDQAFFVICDQTTMTQQDISMGKLRGVFGIALIKPSEFVDFIFEITPDGVSVYQVP